MRSPFGQSLTVAALGLTIFLSGCAESNEKAAGIGTGTASADAPKSQADYGAQMKGAGGGMPGYPGKQPNAPAAPAKK